LEGEKRAVSRPRLPHISPQLDHKNTAFTHRVSAKTPAKTPIHHNRKKQDKNRTPTRHADPVGRLFFFGGKRPARTPETLIAVN
jgi:hypothetical protein